MAAGVAVALEAVAAGKGAPKFLAAARTGMDDRNGPLYCGRVLVHDRHGDNALFGGPDRTAGMPREVQIRLQPAQQIGDLEILLLSDAERDIPVVSGQFGRNSRLGPVIVMLVVMPTGSIEDFDAQFIQHPQPGVGADIAVGRRRLDVGNSVLLLQGCEKLRSRLVIEQPGEVRAARSLTDPL